MLMAQATKKTAHSAPKIVAKAAHAAASATAKTIEKTAKNATSALEGAHQSSRTAVGIGADTMRGLFSSSADEARKAHAKLFAIGREGTDVVSRTLDAYSRTLSDYIALGRENVDVAVEVTNIVSDVSRTANAEFLKFANSNFSDNLDICSETFNCRNVNDLIELNNKWMTVNIDNFFNQSARFADMLFQFASEASEPMNEHIMESAERFSKTIAA